MADEPIPAPTGTEAPAAAAPETPPKTYSAEAFSALQKKYDELSGSYETYTETVREALTALPKYIPEAADYIKASPEEWDRIAEARKTAQVPKEPAPTDPVKIAISKAEQAEAMAKAAQERIEKFEHVRKVDEVGRTAYFELSNHEIFADARIRERAMDVVAQRLSANPQASVSDVVAEVAKEEKEYRDAIVAQYVSGKETVRKGIPPGPTSGGGAPPGAKPKGPANIEDGSALKELDAEARDLVRANK